MPDPFIGQINMFGGNFAPRGWALCDGQLLAISANTALFSILGTTYGGDGRTTFGLPDLRGRAALHAGQGPGLTNRPLGSKGGAETVTLNTQQMPSHNHDMLAVNTNATTNEPVGNILGRGGSTDLTEPVEEVYVPKPAGTTSTLDSTAITNTGGAQAHPNVQPFQTVNYIIALVGIFPSRN